MVNNGRVQGDLNDPIFVAPDYVYIRTNFKRIENPPLVEGDQPHVLYEFDEMRYTHEEYAQLIFRMNLVAQQDIVETQIQLAEKFEGVDE
jgi:hypothetical protein